MSVALPILTVYIQYQEKLFGVEHTRMKTLIIALQKDGQLLSPTFELISAANGLGGETTSLVLAENAAPLAEKIAASGGGTVTALSHPQFKLFNDELYANIIADQIQKLLPTLVLAPANFYGKALISRLAAKLHAGMASDVTGLSVDSGKVIANRPHYGGGVMSQISNNGSGPFFVTVRPKIFPESKSGTGSVVTGQVSDQLLQVKTQVKESKSESSGTLNLTEADIVVSAGRGMRGPEHLPIVKELADSLGAAFGASRAVVDAGWLPYAHQVGQTGRTVNPKLYVAVGISGAIQHLVGMRTSKTIVAINKDKDAPIFSVANYGIVGDAFEIVPALTKKFKAEFGR